MKILNKLKTAFSKAAEYPELQMGWVFGILITGTVLMIISKWLPLSNKVIGTTIFLLIILEYIGRVHKEWQSI